MTDERSFRALLHRVTHRFPGVPAHAERLAGHQARACQGAAPSPAFLAELPPEPLASPSTRVMAAWQSRIAAFFGQELR